jgi:small subunit ribosomal protein S9
MTEEERPPDEPEDDAQPAEGDAAEAEAPEEGEQAPVAKGDAAAEGEPEAPAAEEAPVEEEASAQAEAPAEASEEAPAEASEEAPAEASEEAPAEASEEAPAEASEEAPAEAEQEAPAEEARPRGKSAGDAGEPAIPGADLEVDIVPEGSDPLGAGGEPEAELEAPPEAEADAAPAAEAEAEPAPVAVPKATIDLAAGARYTATGKRKTAIARVILKPGQGEYTVNGRALAEHFPRQTAQRNIRQPLETVGYESRMDVLAQLHGGGISAQAGALRHGISRALIEADPNLRAELKRRGFLTRDPRVKERRKAGLKKARKRPQFSKR